MLKDQALEYFTNLQDHIVKGLESLDGGTFITDSWRRPEGGGGVSRLIENGELFERGGVNFSHVKGTRLPESATAHRTINPRQSWEAMGVSLVMHPRNPYTPTVHMNVRMFATEDGTSWFGGGMDLTPYYYFEDDARHWHQTCKDALDPVDPQLYPKYKQWCDHYFHLKHRNEARGIGGIFFDDVDQDLGFKLVQATGDAFLKGYAAIIVLRRDMPYTEHERDWQLYRRGRYVEFNLVYDRGTLFGLQSNGRTESILMSMPPLVKWQYNYEPKHGTPEDELLRNLIPKHYV
jgi:coproporphyrinogen III oxidase